MSRLKFALLGTIALAAKTCRDCTEEGQWMLILYDQGDQGTMLARTCGPANCLSFTFPRIAQICIPDCDSLPETIFDINLHQRGADHTQRCVSHFNKEKCKNDHMCDYIRNNIDEEDYFCSIKELVPLMNAVPL